MMSTIYLGSRAISRGAMVEDLAALTVRVRGEYVEMPGLRLTTQQAARLFGVTPDVAHLVLNELCDASVLMCSSRGQYSLVSGFVEQVDSLDH